MNVKKNEFIIGLVIIIAALSLIFGIFWLGNSNFFAKGMPINVLLDNANGISKDDPVYYRGLKVGSVKNTEVRKDAVVLKLKIEEIEEIPIDSKFVIKDLSVIGGKVIEINPGVMSKFLENDDTVKAVSAKGVTESLNEFQELKPKIDRILDNVEALSGNEIYKELLETIRELRFTIKDSQKFINGTLSKTTSDIDKITMENANGISNLISVLNQNSIELSKVLNNSSSVAITLDSLVRSINNGNGTIGELVKNDSLYHNLNNSIISIDSLVTDIKKNPNKYINVSVF